MQVKQGAIMARQSSCSTSPPLRLHLLGVFQIERGAQMLRLPTRKIESLLAYLVLHPDPHPREELAALLWGDVTDAQARGSLRKALTLIRQHLGGEILLADRETAQLGPTFPIWVDALEFQRIVDSEGQSEISNLQSQRDFQSAIDLYRGDLLADFYDDWIVPERERYRACYLETLLKLTQAMRSRSDYARAIEGARKVLTLDAANERAHQHLMFCYLATGRRCEALKQYDECERALEIELGVKPAAETTALFEWIRQTPSESKSPAALLTNLPIPLSSFVGRQREMTEIKRLFSQTRLLTLTGAGGCGKTRLAIQVATDLLDSFKDGVWWVDLAPLRDTALVPQMVGKVWGLNKEPGLPLIDMLKNHLRSKQLLLVLDNCEHLIDACALLADELLNACPGLKVMVTSRQALGVTGETIWRVPSLSFPDLDRLPRAEKELSSVIASYESIQLFVDRAAAMDTRFGLTEQNALAVARICHHLDGVPLAIELAAACAPILTVGEILARLNERFTLLTEGSRTALPRHQTLRATMDWSYHLLTDAEAALFRRLSVFVGGFTLEAAEQVTCPTSEVLDFLTHLVNKSLVVADREQRDTRYHLLETIRQYAREKLLECGEDERIRRRHVDFFLRLAEEAHPKLAGAEQEEWSERLEAEHGNLRAAIEWLTERGDAELGLRLGGALWRYWEMRGYLVEGLERLTKLLNLPGASVQTKTRLKGLYATGVLADAQGDYSLARALFEEHLAINRELGDRWGIASSLNNLGIIALRRNDFESVRSLYSEVLNIWREAKYQPNIALTLSNLGNVANLQADYETARALHEESLTIFRALGDSHGVAWALDHLGDVARNQKDFETARVRYAECLAIFRTLGHKSDIASSLADLGNLARDQGDYASARTRYIESMAIFGELGDRRGIARLLESFAGLAAAQHRPERALRLAAAAGSLRETVGAPRLSSEQMDAERGLAIARQTLGQAASQVEEARGAAMTWEQAIAYALEANH